MMSVNLKLYIGVEGTSGREDSGDDQHQGKSALKCKNVYVIGFAQVRNESLAPGLLHTQWKTPSQYRFTILSLIVPAYSYSCGLRALIEARRSTEMITLRNPLNIRFLYN